MATIKPKKQTEATPTQKTPRSTRRITIVEAKSVVAKNSVMAAILAPHDGLVAGSKGESKR